MILTILLSLLTVLQPASADKSPATNPGLLPDVYIELLDDNKTAHVGPGETCVVTFSGLVTVDCNPATRVAVSLSAEDTWGSAVVEPSTLMFNNDGEQPFGVSVQASPRESCETVGTVRVTGTWHLYPGSLGGKAEPTDGAGGTIYIAQFYRFSVSFPNSALRETVAGQEVTYNICISNDGNGMDSYTIRITNLD